jgi:flagellar FliL protein
MASFAEGIEVSHAPSSGKSKPGFVQLVMLIVVSVLISAGLLTGGIYYLVKSGRLGTVTASTLVASAAAKAETEVAPPTHAVVLEPIVVNLADEGGKTYLRLGLTLRVVDPELKKGEKPEAEKPKDTKDAGDSDAAVRDTAIEVLGHQTAEMLLALQGKERLKTDLKTAIAQHNPELKVTEVFFTEFLVQR